MAASEGTLFPYPYDDCFFEVISAEFVVDIAAYAEPEKLRPERKAKR